MRSADPVLRLFVALRPSPATRDLLARAIRRVGEAAPRARLVRPENVHLTLLFLGATPASAVPGIEAALREAARDVAAFAWRIAGLGAFPAVHRPRVVWAGVDPGLGADEIRTLAGRTRAALAGAAGASAPGEPADARSTPPSSDASSPGAPARAASGGSGPEAGARSGPGGSGGEAEEPFHPHLTLARLDPPRPTPALTRLLTAGTLQDTYKPEVASDLALMVSENDGSGVRYRALATVPFAAAPAPGAEGTTERA